MCNHHSPCILSLTLLVPDQKCFSDDLCPFSLLPSFCMVAEFWGRGIPLVYGHILTALSPYEKSGGKGKDRVREKMGLGESLFLLLLLLL